MKFLMTENGENIIQFDNLSIYRTDYLIISLQYNSCGQSPPLFLFTNPFPLNAALSAPSLNYRINVTTGGVYHIWALMKIDNSPASIAFGVDGKLQSLDEQYNHGNLWSYEAKQIWRWTPVSDIMLPPGEHIFSAYAVTTALRLDRFYLTQGDELPPDAIDWKAS